MKVVSGTEPLSVAAGRWPSDRTRETEGLSPVPLRSFVAVATLAAVSVAIPLFAMLPRMRTPYIRAPGARGTGTIVHASGFTDELTMDRVGSIRESREVVLRLRFQQQPEPDAEIRIKAAAYDRYETLAW